MASRFLYLLRHGQFDPNAVANPTHGITKLGKQQARHAAKAFKSIPVTAIHVSTMTRAIATAEILGKNFPEIQIQRAHRLQECVPPVTEDVREAYFSALTDDQLQDQISHAERAYSHYVKRTTGSDRHEVLVCHGNLIRYMVCRVLEVPPTAWVNFTSTNCGITRIVVNSEGNAALLSYNEIGHLPPTHHTDNMHRD
jgi:broad specificity phosphatase PhoE